MRSLVIFFYSPDWIVEWTKGIDILNSNYCYDFGWISIFNSFNLKPNISNSSEAI